MVIYDCTCSECKAEFQAVLEGADDKVKCPSCNSDKIDMKESEMQLGCGGGCGGCSGSCDSEE